MARKRSIDFTAITGMEVYGIDDDKVIITCVPLSEFSRKFGFFCGTELLRELGHGLLRVADKAEKVIAERCATPPDAEKGEAK